ncbi:MAG TPA: DUF5668 domain-containing protein [Dictyoglomaceae bacterium]|nr:DUF5668 domain-containing protein [Dictyoglomaceae bacterium]HOL39020.1 DUF5668 domain-containing protein [Dictyoglomaceae bacterium]HOP94359.1 DUF5668 domain-containing protein [Dictyoglomaceae bacterium]HPP15804.1 DUF5668 domain-containing protein [Dictyoglomaceae bacterium]HPU42793.1 DUF5668 domain-containing protein [Dictyoglomaceae bacterium]
MLNKAFWGLLLLVLGISILANNFNIPILKDIWKLWPLIFIYWGLKLILPQYTPSRRIKNMKEERYKILKLVQEGKITSDEAEELLSKLEESIKRGKRVLRINVVDEDKNVVNITVPLSFLKWGLNLVKNYTNDIDMDAEELEQIINDPNFYGKIVDIDAEDTKVTIEII